MHMLGTSEDFLFCSRQFSDKPLGCLYDLPEIFGFEGEFVFPGFSRMNIYDLGASTGCRAQLSNKPKGNPYDIWLFVLWPQEVG